MHRRHALRFVLAAITFAFAGVAAFIRAAQGQRDPLPSWNSGSARETLVTFVERVTRAGSSEFVVPAERVAVFDNDGTLWCEQPMQVQVFFLIDRVHELAAQDPALKER